MTDVDYMKVAFNLARRAKGDTSPNPMVGAVIVKGNRIVSCGYHRRCGADHAEITAIKAAKEPLQGAKMYVTLEPCSHFGRTPPCVDRIIKSGIKEVVIGTIDPNPLNNGKSIAKLRRAGIKVKVGFLQGELKKLNESFMKFIKYKMPFIVVKCAQTLDGKIALSSGESKWITSKESRDFSHKLRNDFDAILVGINTVLKDNPFLNATKSTKRIKKIIVDSYLRIPLKANIFKNTHPQDIILATTKKAGRAKLNRLAKNGVDVMVAPLAQGKVDLKWLMRKLAEKEITSVLVEGGAKMIGAFLKTGLVDKVLIFIAPKILGDERAVSSIQGLNMPHLKNAIELKNISMKQIKNDFLVEGYVYRYR